MKVYIETEQNVYMAEMPNPTESCLPKKILDEGSVRIYPQRNHHICKYCGGVADGSYDDLLCGSCKDVFGHSLYSEL